MVRMGRSKSAEAATVAWRRRNIAAVFAVAGAIAAASLLLSSTAHAAAESSSSPSSVVSRVFASMEQPDNNNSTKSNRSNPKPDRGQKGIEENPLPLPSFLPRPISADTNNVDAADASNANDDQSREPAASPKKRKRKTQATTDGTGTGTSSKKSSKNQSRRKQVSPQSTTSATTTSTSASTNSMMRRIQREWKDAVQSGTAFDWVRGQPVSLVQQEKARRQKRKRDRQSEFDENDNVTTTNTTTNTTIKPQHLWIGPLSLQQWSVWHFTFTGVPGSAAYSGGVYHGRILLPKTYPAHPPHIQMITPSGRFQTFTDICTSASNFHPETWQPHVWTVYSLAQAVRLHMLTPSNEIGGITASLQERQDYARQSRHFQATLQNPPKQGKDNKAKRGITIDHERMLQAGWIAESSLDDDTAVASSSTIQPHAPLQYAVFDGEMDMVTLLRQVTTGRGDETKKVAPQKRKRRKRQQQKTATRLSKQSQEQALAVVALRYVLQFCQSPLRVLLLGLGVLIMLNR